MGRLSGHTTLTAELTTRQRHTGRATRQNGPGATPSPVPSGCGVFDGEGSRLSRPWRLCGEGGVAYPVAASLRHDGRWQLSDAVGCRSSDSGRRQSRRARAFM